MEINRIIVYSSIVMWLLPPFRQYRGKYFYFFLVLGLEGLSTQLFRYLNMDLYKVYDIVNIVVLLTLISVTSIKKYWYLFFILLTIILLINYTSDPKLETIGIILGHTFIFYIFLKNVAIDYYRNDSLRTSFIILLLYEMTAILKFFFVYRNIHLGLTFFYLTTAFENFIAIFFTIYKVEESPSIKLVLSPPKH